MAKSKLGLDKLNLSQKIALTKNIVTQMTGNAAFPTPVPALATISASADEAQAAQSDATVQRQIAHEKNVIQDNKEAALDAKLVQLAAYVDSASGGDAVKILSAGMAVRAAPSASALPTQTQDLSVNVSDAEGALDLNWDPVHGAKSYTIEMSTTGGTGPWTNVKSVTKSKATVSGLTSGQRVWFHVAAVGSKGQGPWSDPATKIVP